MCDITITIDISTAEYWLDQCDDEIAFWTSVKEDRIRADENPDEMILSWEKAKEILTKALGEQVAT